MRTLAGSLQRATKRDPFTADMVNVVSQNAENRIALVFL
jgi:hypothetical protein